jgi:hypothetical protein
MIEALIEKAPVAPLESMLTEANADRPLYHIRHCLRAGGGGRFPKTSPLRRRDGIHSPSGALLFNPYQWLLKYPAALRPSRILSVSNDFLLFGNLAHHLVDRFFSQPKALSTSDGDFLAWFNTTFDRMMIEEGAVLLMPGRRSDLEGFRIKLLVSIRQLRLQLNAAGIVEVRPEMELTGTYAGGEMLGYADLVLAKASGEKAIVDMKWSGAKKYPEMLKQTASFSSLSTASFCVSRSASGRLSHITFWTAASFSR